MAEWSDGHRLQAAFEDGDLIRPSADALNLVDFARAAASLAGSRDVMMTAGSRRIADLIGPSQHLVLVLADGFGMNLLEAMDSDSFMPHHLATELQTVFPSTTAAALTSLATAEWPIKHAVLGWFLLNRGDSTALGIQSRPQSLGVRMYGVMVAVVSAGVAFLKLTGA